MHVDDLNLIRTHEELTTTTKYLKKEFEMKDLRKTKLHLDLQIEHFPTGVLVHHPAYSKKSLKLFYMDKALPLSSPMIVHSLDVKNNPFLPCEKGEELLGPEVPYFSAIGAFMYLANCTRLDISFSVNLLAKYSFVSLASRNNLLGLFYLKESKQQLFRYANIRYLSDPHKARSQTRYVFNCNGTTISWRSFMKTMVTTSSNH